MPPRWITAAIIAFWLATTAWLVYHELSLRYRGGQPPPFAIDLTDEVGANTISWNVLQDGQVVGLGQSSVNRRPDRTFELYSHFSLTDVKLLEIVDFKKLISRYRVNEHGDLISMSAEVSLEGLPALFNSKVTKVFVSGKVEEGYFSPQIRVEVGGIKVNVPFSEKVKVPQRGSVLNPMHLVNKINGLGAGQRWTIPLLNPLSFQKMTVPTLDAEVFMDSLRWRDEQVACYRIDYREPGKKVTARTWVRRRDGLVLQQEAEHQGRQIILQRDK